LLRSGHAGGEGEQADASGEKSAIHPTAALRHRLERPGQNKPPAAEGW
jgi:hypothetical protein